MVPRLSSTPAIKIVKEKVETAQKKCFWMRQQRMIHITVFSLSAAYLFVYPLTRDGLHFANESHQATSILGGVLLLICSILSTIAFTFGRLDIAIQLKTNSVKTRRKVNAAIRVYLVTFPNAFVQCFKLLGCEACEAKIFVIR